VIETRKKLWRDADGNIVSKRPAQADPCRRSSKTQVVVSKSQGQAHQTVIEGCCPQIALRAEPLSPPRSMLSTESINQFSQLPELPDGPDFLEHASGPDMFEFFANSSWGSQPRSSVNSQLGGPSDDMFNPDTGEEYRISNEYT
jgi:hypothetical protein